MARNRDDQDYIGPLRRLGVAVLVVILLALFLVWRIDSPRMERFRSALVDRFVPSFDWAMAPVTKLTDMVEGFQSYSRIYEQNQELRRELQQMRRGRKPPFSWSSKTRSFWRRTRCGSIRS